MRYAVLALSYLVLVLSGAVFMFCVLATGCSTLPTPIQPAEVQTSCDKFLTTFEDARRAGLSCEEGRLKAQTAAPMCAVNVVCKTRPTEVDSGLSE